MNSVALNISVYSKSERKREGSASATAGEGSCRDACLQEQGFYGTVFEFQDGHVSQTGHK